MSPQRSRDERNRSHPRVAYGVVLATVIGFAIIASVIFGQDHRGLSPFPQLPARKIVLVKPEPIAAAERGLEPNPVTEVQEPSSLIRAIEILPHQIRLESGGQVVRHDWGFDGKNATLKGIVKTVNEAGWIEESGPGAFVLKAALLLDPETKLIAAAPAVTSITMDNRPGVFIGTQAAYLLLGHVTVTSSDSLPADTAGKTYVPFILARHRARMDIVDSTISGLGWDWNSSYGVSWAGQAKGVATGSTFEHNFIGAYTNHVTGVVFRGNRFVHNKFYGLDPHTYSSALVVSHNLAAYNGRHGIIFSNHVTGGNVLNNVSRHNGENGIVMDEQSTDNLIMGNHVEDNAGDGIVFSESNRNTADNNLVESNRVGIHGIHGSQDETLNGNTLKNNDIASQGVSLGSANSQKNNGGEWKPSTLESIWLAAALATILLWVFTYLVIHRRKRYIELA